MNSTVLIILPLDFFLPLNILSANDVARLILPCFLGEDSTEDDDEGHGSLDDFPDRLPELVRGRGETPSPTPATLKPRLLSGGVTSAIESSDESSDDTETL